ncbi:hypothetical protein [Psychrobacter aquaticus]|uniref:Saccharopine dehydrogenase n=1 Tax=Psychrobacter aquaticus CMS 56 TaxID=1354303 RepID=U4T8E9_9GAMM|nr:hypothetical protein [Psychrobacter aquaticus]ERL54748.1 hypothetical protein M917_2094 [Psychrobacter aquaticus CMS 56]
MNTKNPILFAGATGIVGQQAIEWFRTINPKQAVYIGGRNIQLADEIALKTGNASSLAIDAEQPNLGIDDSVEISAVMMLAPDSGSHGLRLAQKRKIPYMNVVTGMVEIGAELAEYALTTSGPVLLASHWAAGAATFLALHLAEQFDSVSTLNIAVVLDPEDIYGPAAFEDMERLQAGVPSAFSYENGKRKWLTRDAIHHKISTIDGRDVTGTSFASLDTVSLRAVTGAENIRFDIASDISSFRKAKNKPAAEIIVTATGSHGGAESTRKLAIEFHKGQSSLTGLCSSLLLNELIKKWQLDNRATLYTPESLGIKPEVFLKLLKDFGARIVEL